MLQLVQASAARPNFGLFVGRASTKASVGFVYSQGAVLK
jgi:hypothetical protein